MKRWTQIFVALGTILALQTAVPARADRVVTSISVGDPYRGTLTFRSAPDMMLIPNTNVYTIRGNEGYDLYRYDGWFYLVDDGGWYRAQSWRGPFTYVTMQSVPRQITTIPTMYRRTWSTSVSSNWGDNDRDNDGIADRYDNDRDNDGVVDRYDTDRDNDGVPERTTSYGNDTYGGTRRYVVRETYNFRPGVRYRGTYLTFRTPPRMGIVPGTRVYYVRDNTFDRDLYRYAGNWYYVENGTWYVADDWRGPFFTVRWRDVPASVRRLPSPYRRTWTYSGGPDYGRRDDGLIYRGRSTRVVRYGERTDFVLDSYPSMSIIPGTNVYFMRDRADYDLYRYGNSWYLVDSGFWYRAPSWRGPFIRIRASAAPRAVFTIPSGYRKTWVPSMD